MMAEEGPAFFIVPNNNNNNKGAPTTTTHSSHGFLLHHHIASAYEAAAMGGASKGAPLRLSRAQQAKSSMTSLLLLMISLFACFYTAGRLWQDAEMRYLLVGNSEKRFHQDGGSLSVDETLKLLDCKDQQKRLTDAELELAAAKSKGYVSKYGVSSNGTATGHRLHAVVGVMTNFGSRSRREAIRKNLLPSGTTLQELEDNKGIVIRFVIGRSANGGDMSDKQIDRENSDTNDFLILGDHVESDDNLTHKTKLYFSTAVESWDADFYLKVDDNILVNIDKLGVMLASHWDKPRVYIGCMKSGEVISDPNAQWYEPEWWRFGEQKSEYHRHAAGQMYALSRALAQYISINSASLHDYQNEDVSVGAWMLGLEAELVDDRKLCCGASTGGICTTQ
ncbi:hypothetical protein CY35_09G106300 [Sphagnum magellanicum]|nr:hypothetical protein CY35_09G106300 [Sphagnum magellanicum]